MRIGVMLRHLPTESGGIGRYTRKLLDHLLRIDKENDYFLFHKDASAVGVYRGLPNVQELSKPAPSKLLWDQVIVPRLARSLKLDLIFNPKI